MKTLARIITMTILMVAGTWVLPQKASAQFPGIGFQVFYDQLTPYGAWINDPTYGYVWIPDVAEGFIPYGTAGHWIFTVYGWTWISDYDWGWAPFHYGRWYFDSYYGWIWVPGREWGPAWVSWRRCDDYYGWAPLVPGVTFAMTFRPGFLIPDDYWMFVRDRDFDRRDIGNYYIGRRNHHELILKSRPIENTYIDNKRNITYISGPDIREVRKTTGRDIKPLLFSDNNQPGKTLVTKDKIEIYRPPVKREEVNNIKPAPSKIITKNNITPITERKQGNLTKVPPAGNTIKTKEQMPPSKKINPPKYERNDNLNRNNNKTTISTGKGSEGQSGGVRQDNSQRKSIPSEQMNQQNENHTKGQTVQPRTGNPEHSNPKIQQRRANQQNPKVGTPKKTNEIHPIKNQKAEPAKK